MNFTVLWQPRAASELMGLWIRAANKDAIAGCIDEIDRILSRRPAEQGESRTGSERLWFNRPLSVFFRIDKATRTVLIRRVRWMGE